MVERKNQQPQVVLLPSHTCSGVSVCAHMWANIHTEVIKCVSKEINKIWYNIILTF